MMIINAHPHYDDQDARTMRVRGPPSRPGGWDPHRERGRVRSAHHAQINEPLQRPQVRRQCILNCRLSLRVNTLLGDETSPASRR